jgi:predicted GTPase
VDIRTVRIKHPIRGHSVTFVDTPGFGDTYKSDTEILTEIAEWFVKRSVYYVEQLLYTLIDDAIVIKAISTSPPSSTCIGSPTIG